jgi:hypothetical protein
MLHHVSLEVTPADHDRFAELLAAIGFAPVAAPDVLGDSVRWFGRSGTQVHLILTDAATVPLLGHAAFVVDDLPAAMADLSERGFDVGESQELWGERRAFVVGPGGHRLELMAAPPP